MPEKIETPSAPKLQQEPAAERHLKEKQGIEFAQRRATKSFWGRILRRDKTQAPNTEENGPLATKATKRSLMDRILRRKPKPKANDLESEMEEAFSQEAKTLGIKKSKREAWVQKQIDQTFDAADQKVDAREKGLKEGQIDPLTKLPLRSHLTEALTRVHGLMQHGAKVDAALLIIDVDDFKRINDTYGHPGGDAVLVALANLLRARKRDSDTVVRYGGEEIAILIEGASGLDAKEFANQIKDAIRAEVAQAAGIKDKKKVTVSVGFSSFKFDPDNIDPETGQPSLTSIEDIVKEADFALYRAKHTGKDKVVKFNKLMLPEEDVKAEETKVSQKDFLELALNYISSNLTKEAGEVKTLTENSPFLNDPQHQKFSEEILQSANDLEKYLPLIVSVTRDALSGKPVKIINSAVPFFAAGVFPEQAEKYKDLEVERTYSPDEISEIISLFSSTLETQPRHDITKVRGWADLLEKFLPEEALASIVDTVVDIDDRIFMIQSLARKVSEDKPIPVASIEGQRRLVLEMAA